MIINQKLVYAKIYIPTENRTDLQYMADVIQEGFPKGEMDVALWQLRGDVALPQV